MESVKVAGSLVIARNIPKMEAPIKISAIIHVVCTAWINDLCSIERIGLPQTGVQITAIMKAIRAAKAAASAGVKIPPSMPARGMSQTPNGRSMMKPITDCFPDGA